MVREEDKQAPQRFRRFSGFLGSVRLIFDFLILLLVMLIIGFVVFANGIERDQHAPNQKADGIAVLTGGVARIDNASTATTSKRDHRIVIWKDRDIDLEPSALTSARSH